MEVYEYDDPQHKCRVKVSEPFNGSIDVTILPMDGKHLRGAEQIQFERNNASPAAEHLFNTVNTHANITGEFGEARANKRYNGHVSYTFHYPDGKDAQTKEALSLAMLVEGATRTHIERPGHAIADNVSTINAILRRQYPDINEAKHFQTAELISRALASKSNILQR